MSDARVLSMLESISERLARLETAVGAGPAKPTAASIAEFDELIRAEVEPFAALSAEIDASVGKMGDVVLRTFRTVRNVLELATQHQKPSPEGLQAIMRHVSAHMKELAAERGDPNYTKAINEAMQAFGWLAVPETPASFIGSFAEGVTFWTNRVRTASSGNEKAASWCEKLLRIVREMEGFVKRNHTTGLVWNPSGAPFDPAALSGGAATAPAPAPAAAPAPRAAASSTGAAAPTPAPAAALGNVFAELKQIDQSSGRTAGLRHVADAEKVYKNTSLRAGAAVPGESSAAAAKPRAAAAVAAAAEAKPPVCKKVPGQSRWVVEYQRGPEPVVIEEDNPRFQVYIFKCENASIIIKGKVKAINVDQCTKTNVIFDSIISSCELVNCKRVNVQVKQTAPSVAVDKTDGCVVYLNWTAIGAQIVTSKSSEINVSFPKDSSEDEWVELPVPEQFVHRLRDGVVVSSVSELYG